MIWLTWRQFRVQALAAVLGLTAVAAAAALTGPRLARLARSGRNVFDLSTGGERTLFLAGVVAVAVVPALVGAFWGAPLIARELEAGTHRLAWNQSVTRSRWLAVKLGVTALAAALAAGLTSLAVTWWSGPLDGASSTGHGGMPQRLTPVTFAMRGVVPVGYAVLAVVLGATLGAVLRRTLPAMAVTLAVYAALQIAVPLWVRPHLAAPVTATIVPARGTLDGISSDESGRQVTLSVHTPDPRDWILSDRTVDPAGRPAGLPASFVACLPPPGGPVSTSGQAQAPASGPEECLGRLAGTGYRQQVVYQPGDRFWRLQWTELALYLAASGVVAALCFHWVRRRVT